MLSPDDRLARRPRTPALDPLGRWASTVATPMPLDCTMDITLNKDGVDVTVLDGPYLAAGKPTPRAVADYTRLIEQVESLKGFAADKLLDLYNDTWVDEDIGEVDRAGFINRLTKPAVHLYDEIGAAVVYFEDGGLFAGHYIEISIDDGQPTDAHIAG
jgi:hypothetical protein